MKTIVIIGGVAAGMSCAARLRRLDEHAHIIVLEKDEDISVATCALPYYVSGEITKETALRVQTPESMAASLNLDIRVGHEAVFIDSASRTLRVRSPHGMSDLAYDALVLTPGARAVQLPIPGIDLPEVTHLRTLRDGREVRERALRGGRAVVIGAGFIGIEAAEALRIAGMDVVLVEGSEHVLPPIEEELSSLVVSELEDLGIRVLESARVNRIEKTGEGVSVLVDTKGAEDSCGLDADLVVVAIGARARVELAESAGLTLVNGAIGVDSRGRTSQPWIWAGGDAAALPLEVTGVLGSVPLAGPASRAGRRIADDIVAVLNATEATDRVTADSGSPAGLDQLAEAGGTGRGDAIMNAHDTGEDAAVDENTALFHAGARRTIAPPLGTAVLRVGRLQVAMTGANSRELDRQGIAYTVIHDHHAQHVTSFPGASLISIVAFFGRDGRILGAQAVGCEGIARRIDVLATAIRAGVKIDELSDLDLAYSPPFGAPKDPVNMLGMIGENLRTGMLRLWYPWELEEIRNTHLILDVRQDDEIAQGPRIPGSFKIAHTQLRGRLDEVREAAAGRPIAVHCRSGVRSYFAHRVLADAGVESTSLSGGMLTLEAWARRHPGLIEY